MLAFYEFVSWFIPKRRKEYRAMAQAKAKEHQGKQG
jgi:hypothetical protein